MSLNAVIERARAELGYTESPPNSNLTKYGAAYGWNGVPWCVEFPWWCFREAGESAAFYGGMRTASCGELLRWHREHGQTVPVGEVRIGDISILNFSGTQDTEHCGLVTKINRLAATGQLVSITTIEGNTTPGYEGSQDNGGCVALKVRYPRQIVAVIRPQYKEEPMQDFKDYKGHWAEDALDWAVARGLIEGYEDGTIRPDANITRAEMLTILKRYDEWRNYK